MNLRIRGGKFRFPLAWTLTLLLTAASACLAAGNVSFLSATAQDPITLGEPLTVTVQFQNTGIAEFRNYAFLSSYPWQSSLSGGRWGWIGFAVAPGETRTEEITIRADGLPNKPGTYSVKINAYHSFYYDPYSMNWDVNTGMPMAGNPKTVKFKILAPPTLSVTPSSLDFGEVPMGGAADRIFTVKNTGGGTISGVATVSSPFSVLSGESYDLAAGQSQSVTIRYSPVFVGDNEAEVAFTGGTGATRRVSGSSYEPPMISDPGPQEGIVGVVFNLPLQVQSTTPATLTVSGLPSGLKYNATQKAIVGVPLAAVTDTTVTIKARDAAGHPAVPQTFQMTVVPLPPWAFGTFNGWYRDESNVAGVVSMTVSKQGKVSGKCQVGGSYTFSAPSYAAGSSPGTGFRFTSVAKGRDDSVPLEVIVRQHGAAGGPALLSVAEGWTNGAMSGAAPMAMYRNVWLDADMKPVATNLDGYYTATLPGDGSFGSGYVGLTLKKGSVKTGGKLGDGTAVSMSSTLLVDESNRYFTVLYSTPRAYLGGSFFGVAEFVKMGEGEPVVVRPLEGEALIWDSYDPKATGVYREEFRRDMWLVGGWYDKLGNLYAYYEGKELSVGVAGPVPEILVGDTRYESVWWDPSGRPLSVVTNALGVMTGIKAEKVAAPVWDGADWLYDPDTNTVGLVFSLTRPTGVFKGSFKAWFDYGTTHTSKSIPFSGILTPEREDMDDGIEGRGYYLWPDKAQYINAQDNVVSYPFKWSCDFKIQSEQ